MPRAAAGSAEPSGAKRCYSDYLARRGTTGSPQIRKHQRPIDEDHPGGGQSPRRPSRSSAGQAEDTHDADYLPDGVPTLAQHLIKISADEVTSTDPGERGPHQRIAPRTRYRPPCSDTPADTLDLTASKVARFRYPPRLYKVWRRAERPSCCILVQGCRKDLSNPREGFIEPQS